MPRTSRVVVPDLPHQVCFRGNNRRRLFSRASDYLSFLFYLRLALIQTGCLLHQLTLMTNHVHLIITPPLKDALSQFVKRTCQRYAQTRNERRRGSGKLFEERYFSKVIDTERYLASATIYNDANAARDGIVANPEQHRWSTAAYHCGVEGVSSVSREIWTPSFWYLAQGQDERSRAASYQQLIADYLATRDRDADIPDEVKAIEARSRRPYTLRLERPDGSWAAEGWLPSRSGEDD